MEHTFTLRFLLLDDNWEHDALAQRLDAPEHIALEFTRDSGSMDEAIESARADVMGALPTALLIEPNGS